MVIGIFGESCTGKSTIAEKISQVIGAEIYSGKDYLRFAKNEADALRQFIEFLNSCNGTVIYIISEKEHLQFLPQNSYRILVTASLDVIKERFAKRTGGVLPPAVATMLERRYGMFDNEKYDLHIKNTEEGILKACNEVICAINKAQKFNYNTLSLKLSQIYISKEKLDLVNEWLNKNDFSGFEPILVKDFNKDGNLTITDGHTRAFAAWRKGITQVPVMLDNDFIYEQKETIMAYNECIAWAQRLGLSNVSDLNDRVLSKKEYNLLWDMRCDRMHNLIYGIVSGNFPKQIMQDFKEKCSARNLFIYGASSDLRTIYLEDINLKRFIYTNEAFIEESSLNAIQPRSK